MMVTTHLCFAAGTPRETRAAEMRVGQPAAGGLLPGRRALRPVPSRAVALAEGLRGGLALGASRLLAWRAGRPGLRRHAATGGESASSSRRKGSDVACWVLPCFLGCWVGRGALYWAWGVPIGPNFRVSKRFLQMEGVPGHPRALTGLRPWP